MTDQEVRKELNLLRTEIVKSKKDIQVAKDSFIDEIKSFNKDNISNTPFVEKKYTIWQRIRKVLGMS